MILAGPRAQHSRPAMPVMHPVVTRYHFARVDFGEQPALQALERRIGRLIAEEGTTNISAGTGRLDQVACDMRYLLSTGPAIIAENVKESIPHCGAGFRMTFRLICYTPDTFLT